jgi:hypothetical protein
VLASRATHRAVFFTDCKEAFKEAVLRPGERVAVWDYENGNGPDSQKIAAQVEDEERYAAAEARDLPRVRSMIMESDTAALQQWVYEQRIIFHPEGQPDHGRRHRRVEKH